MKRSALPPACCRQVCSRRARLSGGRWRGSAGSPTAVLFLVGEHAYREVCLHGCRAFGELSRAVVEPRLEQVPEGVERRWEQAAERRASSAGSRSLGRDRPARFSTRLRLLSPPKQHWSVSESNRGRGHADRLGDRPAGQLLTPQSDNPLDGPGRGGPTQGLWP